MSNQHHVEWLSDCPLKGKPALLSTAPSMLKISLVVLHKLELCLGVMCVILSAEFEPQPRLGMAGGVHKTVRAGNNHAIRRDTSRLGSWSQAQKLELVRLVRELHPCGAAGWEVNKLVSPKPPHLATALSPPKKLSLIPCKTL